MTQEDADGDDCNHGVYCCCCCDDLDHDAVLLSGTAYDDDSR